MKEPEILDTEEIGDMLVSTVLFECPRGIPENCVHIHVEIPLSDLAATPKEIRGQIRTLAKQIEKNKKPKKVDLKDK